MADNPLAKLPLAGQLGVSLLIAGLIGLAFWYFLYDDMVTQEATKSAELSRLQAEIRTLEVTAAKLEEFRREVTAREAKLETLKRILPADKETPELMKKVQYLASQSNLYIKKFTPGQTVRKSFQPEPPGGAPRPAQPVAQPPAQPGRPGAPGAGEEYYQEWPINIRVDGNYHNLGFFVDRVRRLSRLVNIGNMRIKLASNPTVSRTIDVECVATTFVYVEAPAQAPAGAR